MVIADKEEWIQSINEESNRAVLENSTVETLSPSGTRCKFLGFDPKSNAASVVHMDSDGMPVRRTTEILERSYQETEVAFNIDPRATW